ncbi:MAG: hypothetical protein QXP80_06245 [Zestosphaera sp.]
MVKSLVKVFRDVRKAGLTTTLLPSFTLPLFTVSKDGRKALKKYGYCRDLILMLDDARLYASSDSSKCIEYAGYLSGSWYDVETYSRNVSEDLREVVDSLTLLYSDVGISVSPVDDVELLSVISLSRNTDYHKNAVPWARKLLETSPSLEALAWIDRRYLAGRVGNSYQVLELPDILKCYARFRSELTEDPESSRILLQCRGIGSKTLYAYMLFVRLATSYAPIDVNLLKFLRRFSVLNALTTNYKQPVKEYCMRYSCGECPRSDKCLEESLRRRLGGLNGWFQTIVYLHSKVFCSQGRCVECVFKRSCLTRLR